MNFSESSSSAGDECYWDDEVDEKYKLKDLHGIFDALLDSLDQINQGGFCEGGFLIYMLSGAGGGDWYLIEVRGIKLAV